MSGRNALILFFAVLIVIGGYNYTTSTKQKLSTHKMSELEAALSFSDRYDTHKDVFREAAVEMIEDGTCSVKDFDDMGGWTKSTGKTQHRPYYFTYCGAMRLENRFYLDVVSKRIFQLP